MEQMLSTVLESVLQTVTSADKVTAPPTVVPTQSPLTYAAEPKSSVELAGIVGPAVGSVVGLLLLLGTILLLCKWWLRSRQKKSLHNSGSETFSPNDPQMSAPVRRLLIPRQNVEIGDAILGSGQFGVVHQGVASGLYGGSGESIAVAVKKLSCKDQNEFREFVKEVEIMARLPRHLNVVNLLGVTLEGPPFILLEYCLHGSLRQYLLDRRASTLRSLINIRNDPHFTDSNDQTVSITSGAGANMNCGPTFEHTESETAIDSPLTIMDLTKFAYEISRGMEFLSANRIIHRDLAARNILIGDNHVAKIGDFGLARREQVDYVVRSKTATLPTKWMAPETLQTMVFSEKTDVWSFGITLWEIFSIGGTPYSELNSFPRTLGDLTRLLNNGYQMECPLATPIFIFAFMQMCWSLNPNDRPTFRQARMNLQSSINDDYYVKMESVYDDHNIRELGNAKVEPIQAPYC
ncbi:Receptor-type tyrosine-protein kinase FLT3 [Hypsibius exemplaris]|uniref:Receptor-type tyrosine-protein kinase FLT3 n=1 Tax=Hypsibius exemplaris TaxID=2072580 RepID=A0A1W0X9L2_HYPEX|nr:Receptor-type tyrosine-protein kinase FLT3 [Hypsibius exemplaris]